MRGVLESMEELEAVRGLRKQTRLDDVRRMIVFVVNSLSVPEDELGPVRTARPTTWSSCSRRRASRSTAIRTRRSNC